ncbi:MAG: hypothetical protein RSD67_00190 [Oscillospiraceae bacterium]
MKKYIIYIILQWTLAVLFIAGMIMQILGNTNGDKIFIASIFLTFLFSQTIFKYIKNYKTDEIPRWIDIFQKILVGILVAVSILYVVFAFIV